MTHTEQRAKLVEMMIDAVIIDRFDGVERIFWREKFIRAIAALHSHYTINECGDVSWEIFCIGCREGLNSFYDRDKQRAIKAMATAGDLTRPEAK